MDLLDSLLLHLLYLPVLLKMLFIHLLELITHRLLVNEVLVNFKQEFFKVTGILVQSACFLHQVFNLGIAV